MITIVPDVKVTTVLKEREPNVYDDKSSFLESKIVFSKSKADKMFFDGVAKVLDKDYIYTEEDLVDKE